MEANKRPAYEPKEKDIYDIMKILRTSPSLRTSSDIDKIFEVFCKFQVFKQKDQRSSINSDLLRQCARNAIYEFHKRGDIIFHIGSPADKFYMILNGSVSIFTPKTEYEKNIKDHENLKLEAYKYYTQIFLASEKDKKSLMAIEPKELNAEYVKILIDRLKEIKCDKTFIDMFIQSKGLFSRSPGIDFTFEEKILFLSQNMLFNHFSNGIPLFKMLNLMNDGTTFGEIGLIFSRPRTSTAVAAEDTDLMIISKGDYFKLFEKEITSIQDKVIYMQKIFPSLSQVTIAKLGYTIQEIKYNNNEKIYEEGDDADAFYIIRRGEVKLCKSIGLTTPPIDDVHNIISTYLNKKSRKKNVPYAHILEGDMFGEDDIVFNRKRNHSAIATVFETIIYKLNKKIYFGLLEKNYPDLIHSIKEQAYLKEAWREKIIKDMISKYKEKNFLMTKVFNQSELNSPSLNTTNNTMQISQSLSPIKSINESNKNLKLDETLKKINPNYGPIPLPFAIKKRRFNKSTLLLNKKSEEIQTDEIKTNNKIDNHIAKKLANLCSTNQKTACSPLLQTYNSPSKFQQASENIVKPLNLQTNCETRCFTDHNQDVSMKKVNFITEGQSTGDFMIINESLPQRLSIRYEPNSPCKSRFSISPERGELNEFEYFQILRKRWNEFLFKSIKKQNLALFKETVKQTNSQSKISKMMQNCTYTHYRSQMGFSPKYSLQALQHLSPKIVFKPIDKSSIDLQKSAASLNPNSVTIQSGSNNTLNTKNTTTDGFKFNNSLKKTLSNTNAFFLDNKIKNMKKNE